MPYNPNDPNYQTKNSRVLSFNDFEENIGKEKEELKKVDRSFKKPDSENQTPGNTKFKYNKVTHKIDTLSKSEVVDDLDAIEIKDKGHKYKIVESNSPILESEGIFTIDRKEDGGCALISDVFKFETINSDEETGMFAIIQSWDENLKHDDINNLIGKRVKIKIEIL